MWSRYKQTFWATQISILLVVLAVCFAIPHRWVVAGTFLLMMELGAVAGAAWAARLKAKLERLPS